METLPLFQNLESTDKYAGLSRFSVSSLRDRINKMIKETFSSPILVSGIISSEPKKYPSFVFFDIKDEKDNVSFTVMGYIGTFYNIEKKIKDTGVVDRLGTDIPIMFVVEPAISREKNVQIRLNLVDVVPEYTKSKLMSAKDETVNRLIKEELFNRQKELALPMLITRLGLITSDQGTSVRDITTAMGVAVKHLDIVFQPVRVEGKDAVLNIAAAIELFNKEQKKLKLDAIIIARGGGSTADLAPFNNYELCKAVCLSKLPIISAIGHDKDEHAIELCSHLTPLPSTPSGIGAFIKNRYAELEDDLQMTVKDIAASVNQKFAMATQKLLTVVNVLNNRLWGLKNIRAQKVHGIKQYIALIVQGIPRLITNREKEISNMEKIISAYDHKAILKRGYTVIINDFGTVVKTANDMPDRAGIEFYDGIVRVRREN